ncbi:hypothetical protein ACLB2K_076272 [Fragaria x ananassa]
MDVDGDRQESTEWTLEHHKTFVDVVIRLGGFNKVGTPRSVLAEMMNNVKGLSQRTLVHHMVLFQPLNKRTHLSLGRRSQPACSDPYQSLVNDFEGLQVACPKRLFSSWTVEHHKRVVEAVTKLGGLSKATPTAVLRLMDEERRQGLTVRILRRHLSADAVKKLITAANNY